MTRLELERRRRGMTLRELGAAAGVSHALVGQYETQRLPATEESGKKIARALEMPEAKWKTLQKPA